jgi:hypothetical protein
MNRATAFVIIPGIALLAVTVAQCAKSAPPPPPLPVRHEGVVLIEDFSARQVFPADNPWNLDITNAPVDKSSEAIIAGINSRGKDGRQRLHPDMAKPPWGIPYVGVGGEQPLVPVTFTGYPEESDSTAPGRPGGYPIPEEAMTQENYIENAAPGGHTEGDRHLLIIDRDHWILYELYMASWNADAARWEAVSGAVFDLNSNARRPDGWTSTDAAGLAVFPGLVRRDEVVADGPITHAFRVAVKKTNDYVWPASHAAGTNPGAPPLGTRLRLKASKDISGYPSDLKKIFQAMKTYGLIIADNGGNMYVTGTMDPAWDNGVLNPAFHSLYADDFEVIELGWKPTP